ncbi:hypothetical protein B0O80DRAFT_441702 [Mortierella sp. GBAus27b]|nr:hypothetical protein B0O80DRAFT_441702 [Mortierella sp. GBAus27b]
MDADMDTGARVISQQSFHVAQACTVSSGPGGQMCSGTETWSTQEQWSLTKGDSFTQKTNTIPPRTNRPLKRPGTASE